MNGLITAIIEKRITIEGEDGNLHCVNFDGNGNGAMQNRAGACRVATPPIAVPVVVPGPNTPNIPAASDSTTTPELTTTSTSTDETAPIQPTNVAADTTPIVLPSVADDTSSASTTFDPNSAQITVNP